MTEEGADLTTIQPKVVASSFWCLADAFLAQTDHAQQLITSAGLRAPLHRVQRPHRVRGGGDARPLPLLRGRGAPD